MVAADTELVSPEPRRAMPADALMSLSLTQSLREEQQTTDFDEVAACILGAAHGAEALSVLRRAGLGDESAASGSSQDAWHLDASLAAIGVDVLGGKAASKPMLEGAR